MIDWLVEDYGFDKYEALQLLGQTAHALDRQRGRSAVLRWLARWTRSMHPK